MYSIQYLSPQEIQAIDPSGRCRESIARLKGNNYLPLPDYLKMSPDDYRHVYLERVGKLRTQAHEAYFLYNDEMLGKWHRQGGTFPLEDVLKYYESSYTNALATVSCDVLNVGRDYLIKCIRSTLSQLGSLSQPYSPVTGTFAGPPSGGTKGTFDAETLGMHPGFRHLYPVVPGVRRMRGKDRVINQDANPNVRLVEPYSQRLRYVLKTALPQWFGAWLNPREVVKPMITNAISRRYTNIETDYTHMDEYYSRTLAIENFLPVWETVLTPGEALYAAQYLTEVFEQPVFCGHYLLTGIHNWFSGITLTQDAETVYSVCLHLGAVLKAGYNPQHCQLISIGDDVLLMTPHGWNSEKIRYIVQQEADNNHMLLSVEKCRHATPDYRFCRLVYYPRARRYEDGTIIGAYPTALALNSIVQPETMSTSVGVNTIACLQRLDNCVGSPDYLQVVDLVRRYTTVFDSLKFSGDDIKNYSARDWWFRVYGESWNPDVSPTYRYLISRG